MGLERRRRRREEITFVSLEIALELALDLVAREWELKSPLQAPFLDLRNEEKEMREVRMRYEECQGFMKIVNGLFGPLSNNTPKSTFLISIPYVNIDPSPIKMVPGPNTVIYAKR